MVDAATARAAGELGVLPGREVYMGLPVELDHPFQHHGSRRHVDAEREGLGGEHDLDQAADEELLHDVLERRQKAGVVRREPARPRGAQLTEVQHLEILFWNALHALVDDLYDLGALLGRRQLFAGAQTLKQRAVAPRAGENEHDGGEHVLPLQRGDDLWPAHRAYLVLSPHTAAAGAGAKAPPLFVVAAALV